MPVLHDLPTASPWIQRWAHLMPADGQVLDLACGRGRHMHDLAQRGLHVTGVDRDTEALAVAAAYGSVVHADVEQGPWPFMAEGAPRTFDGIVVTHYLWRSLFPTLVRSLAPGGVLLYETFAQGNETVGKPSRPDFLLRPGELLAVCSELRVVAYEDGFLSGPDRFVQRIAAVREHSVSTAETPKRYRLQSP
jgi:SAM-dependent methyltransferase